jgi:hypothetical protein
MKCQKPDRTFTNCCGMAIWLCRDDLLPVGIVWNPLSLRLLFIMRSREIRFSGCFHILIDLHQPVGTYNLLGGDSRACPGFWEFTTVPVLLTPSIATPSSVVIFVSALPIFQI